MFLPILENKAARAVVVLCISAFVALSFSARADAASSGQPMPVGDLDGFKQIFKDDFNTNASTGNFPGSAYDATWDTYPDGLWDTFKVAKQYPSRVLSVSNSNLTWNFHFRDGYPQLATAVPRVMGPNTSPYKAFAYGRYSVRIRTSQPTPGYQPVFLLWPDSDTWPGDGEIDYPAGDISSTIYGSVIRAQSPAYHDHAMTNFTWTTWHTATIDWRPGLVAFYLDGQLLGSFNQNVPHKPMHWVLQVDSNNNSPAASPTAQGNLEVDWVSVWKWDGASIATTAPPSGEPLTGAAVLRAVKNRSRCRGSAKPSVVGGVLSVKFPKGSKKRKASIPNTKLTNFRSVDTRKIANGTYRLLTKYKRKKNGRTRTIRGCRRITVAN